MIRSMIRIILGGVSARRIDRVRCARSTRASHFVIRGIFEYYFRDDHHYIHSCCRGDTVTKETPEYTTSIMTVTSAPGGCGDLSYSAQESGPISVVDIGASVDTEGDLTLNRKLDGIPPHAYRPRETLSTR